MFNMTGNHQFACAIHMLTLLALSEKPVSSQALAASVGVHPVTVRKVMLVLKEAGLIKTFHGSAGGATLNREPSQISLREVYLTLREHQLFETVPDLACPVGKGIQAALAGYFDESERALLESLGSMTIESLHKKIEP